MWRRVAGLALWVWFASGVMLYVAHRQELYPAGTLFTLLGLWLATGLVGGIALKAFGNRKKLDPADGVWFAELLRKYAPGADQNGQMFLLNAFLNRHRTAIVAGVKPRPNLSKGPTVLLAGQSADPALT